MSKRKFKFGRLVRDNVVQSIVDKGATPEYRKLGEDEFVYELRKKLVSKIAEVEKKSGSKHEMLEELADLYEIINILMKTLGYNENDIKATIELHQKKHGSYNNRIFVDYVECDKNYTYMKYLTENPDKYPEII